ncbi:hypothetical protein BCR39DRAFT_548111 [Naematelia encephala]|uniref:Uncharacterized protein n=1 Tax=Naematelia encephala TaxID=71784 RepID=A0A1Y2AN74_9TREE|nr:hypothetical protein BCR39DRAFT_548111 [Naematelia encephala]
MSSEVPAPSPERRSGADLQRILDSLIGDEGFVLSGNLPDVLLSYETDHDIIILDPSEYDGLRLLCSQHADLELGPKELFSFLSMIPKPQPLRSSSPLRPPPLPHSASLPPSSFRDAQATPRGASKSTSRRHSDRIRSPSDSSGSSSENENEDQTKRFERQASAPPQSQPFPSSGVAVLGTRPLPPKRSKTLSDPSRHDSPLGLRVRGSAVAPTSFGGMMGFARPSPASRRRRGSASARSANGDEEATSPGFDPDRSFARSVSSGSVALTSPPWTRRVDSPVSPDSPIDNTSFHARAKSPEADEEGSVGLAERALSESGEFEGEIGGDEVDEVDGDVVRQGHMGQGLLDPRLSRISTDSANSLRTSHDKLRALQKQNAELARKLKDSERQLGTLGAEHERLVEDLQEKLEEARSEITQRRKDEKELKGKDRAQLIQIAGFEADIQSLQRSLENSKANHANMQKMYNSQCDEAQRLRDLLRDRDAEIQELEAAAHSHQADEEKFHREVQALEAEIKRLESDLSVARQAESVLEVQKQENLQLKETIDRIRFDLEEARAAAASAVGGAGHTRMGTQSSGFGTISRNLGDEINRRLMDVDKVPKEDDGEDVVETIVTTQRTRRVGGRPVKSSTAASTAADAIIQVEDEIREYVDVAANTEPEPEPELQPEAGPSDTQETEHPPAYSAKPEPINAKQVLEHAHPRESARHFDVDVDEGYDIVVDGLGMRCEVLEEEIRTQKVEREKRGVVSRRGRSLSSRRSSYASSGLAHFVYVNTPDAVREHVGQAAFYTVAAFAIGMVAGAHLYGHSGIHPRDLQLFAQMNTLAQAHGVGEGFLPMSSRALLSAMGAGAGMVAGRVPT